MMVIKNNFLMYHYLFREENNEKENIKWRG